jgi:hypothetical protein
LVSHAPSMWYTICILPASTLNFSA